MSDDWAEDAEQKVPPQKTALTAIKTTFVDGIALVLSQLRTAIYTFWGILIAAVAGLVGGLIFAIATSDTIVGIAAGPFIAAAAVVAFLAAAYAGSLTLKSAAASANTQLRAKLDDSTAFPGGTWPSGVLH